MSDSLFEQIGGAPVIDLLIDEFYFRVLADDRLAPFFQDTSLEKQRKAQKEFFSLALDGPIPEREFDLFSVHAGRGIKRQHLSLFTEHLLATMQRVGISDSDAAAVVARIAIYSPRILGESGGVDG